jgi:hypothetical protein
MIDHAMSQATQSFFRDLPQDYYDKFDGDVESPQAWFGIVTIDQDLRAVLAVNEAILVPDVIPDETYLVQIDSNGLVWAFVATPDDTPVTFTYDKLSEQYCSWADLIEGEDGG